MRDHSSDMLRHKLFTLRDRFQDELSTKLFLQVPPSKKRYFDTPLAGWKEIVDRCPKCTRDVEEMNRCFSLSRYTASMFHAMHIAEWGAIEMGNYIGVSDPKRGWAPTQKRLRELIKGGRTSLPTNLSDKFEFLEQMDREVHSMMLAWRHKIDHAANHLAILPNTDFTPDVAEHIIMSVRVFMKRLLDGIQSEQ